MVRELSLVSDPVVLHIWSCLHNYAYGDALFAAERLYAETHNSESLYVLATSLYRIGRPKQVCKLLNSVKPLSPKSRYLLGRCYYDIGCLAEAEDTLLHSSSTSNSVNKQKIVDQLTDTYEEQTCYVLLLLGDLSRRMGRDADAVEYYKRCLQLNPLMWTAFKHLCNIGEYIDPDTAFQLSHSLSLTTPTYAVVIDDFQQSAKPHLDKQDCDKVAIRENLNPEKSYEVPEQVLLSSTGCENTEVNKGFTLDTEYIPSIQRTYISYCSHSFKNDLTADGIKLMDSFHTPNDVISSVVPKAPKPNNYLHDRKGFLEFAMPENISSPNKPTPSYPRFGMLSMVPQSPMFACIPVFSRLNFNPPTSTDSVLSSSVRFGTNQCLPSRQQALKHTDDIQNVSGYRTIGPHNILNQHSRKVTTAHSNTSGTRRTSNNSESETNISTCAPDVLNKTSASARKSRHYNPTSIGVLRHLVSAATLNLGVLTLESTANSTTNSLIHSPVTRLEPPLLRSAVHRTMHSATSDVNSVHESPLTLKSNVQLFNSSSQSPGILSSSSTPRPISNQQNTATGRCPDKTPAPDIHTSGPRTRSQVAAAAAVARASGIQRRSNRLLRSRGYTRKLETKASPSDSLESSPNVQRKSPYGSGCSPSINKHQEIQDSVMEDVGSFGTTYHFRAPLTSDIPDSEKEDPRINSLQQYLELLTQLGRAYQLLVRHHWRSAALLISKLPASQLPTARILAWAARAHMDNADYQTARKIFAVARRIEPWQLYGMDFYSTVLWQLQAEQELSELAHDLLELDRTAPEPWCTVGNCFSLQGEHETAIKFFRRALQVSPTNAYAWTLLGHEQSTLEEFDRALSAFQFALRIDSRHYNALFGMSNVYYKQEKFTLAETFLARAVSLFPGSHLLLTNLAALRSRLGRINDGAGSAMDLITRACKIQPNNPLARYHRASILFHLEQYSEVLSELQNLLVLTPREAMVYLMIGHTYKKLGNTPQAMIHYSWAMELDPKGANTHLRDIMTIPPVTTRGSDRQSTSETGTAEITRRRSRITSFPSGYRGNPEDEFPHEIMDMLSATEEELMNGLLHPSQTRSNPGQNQGFPMSNYSLLEDTEGYNEESVFSDADEEHYDTMDLSGNADGRSGQSVPDD